MCVYPGYNLGYKLVILGMLSGSHVCADVSKALEQNRTVTVLQAQEYHAAPLCIQCVPCACVGAVSVFG